MTTKGIDQGIRGFQKDNDLKVDGIIRPKGETENALLNPMIVYITDNKNQKNEKMDGFDELYYDVLEEAQEMGEDSKRRCPRWNPFCWGGNAATDASNEVLEERQREIEEKHKKKK